MVKEFNVCYGGKLGTGKERGCCGVVQGCGLFELPVLRDGDPLVWHFVM